MSVVSAVQPNVAALQNMEAEEEERVDITEEELVEDDPKARQEEVMLLDPVVSEATVKNAIKPEVQVTFDNEEVDAQLRAMAVSAETGTANVKTSAACAHQQQQQPPSAATSTGTRSAGESHDDLNSSIDRLKPFVRTCSKFESGSGSGDQEGMVTTEDGNDVAAKKRKTRRGKPKHRKLKPYSKQQPSYQQRLRSRAIGRPTKISRQPTAPYNTTQFLMEDHNDLPDLDEKIAGAATGASAAAAATVASITAEVHSHFSKPVAPPRTRDSSFSIDSDEDYFYSSPEDEEEFLQKEFSSAYEDLHAERLGALSKAQLIQEYIQLEARVDMLTKRLRNKQSQQEKQLLQAETVEVESRDPEATKAKLCQQRIDELLQENEQLRREVELLRKQRHGSPMSSVDSESDSDSSCSAAGSSCSCNQHKASPGSSPVPTSYQAHRDKPTGGRARNSSVSSVDSESDSTTGDSSTGATSPKPVATSDVANGHAAHHQMGGLPT